MSGPIDVAVAAWGEPLPDWVRVLAEKCAETSQREAAVVIGYSGSMVSQLLRNSYRGNLAAVEDAVRGAWMGATVECPVMGKIPTNACQEWRRKARKFASSNNHRVRMFRACRACPRNQKDGADA